MEVEGARAEHRIPIRSFDANPVPRTILLILSGFKSRTDAGGGSTTTFFEASVENTLLKPLRMSNIVRGTGFAIFCSAAGHARWPFGFDRDLKFANQVETVLFSQIKSIVST
jgi:hypothetical protein